MQPGELPPLENEEPPLPVNQLEKIDLPRREPSTIVQETIEGKRENTRHFLALYLVTVFAITNVVLLVIAGIGYFKDSENQQTSNLLTLLLTSQTTLMGTALGFYFGERNSS
jgi:hypothetical protein